MRQFWDAAILVNKNGRPFRDAQILPAYVEARLEELKWATIVHELKLQEREEQRTIREQIREEKKVQKEIEKAEKEAAREQKIRNNLRKEFDALLERERKMSEKERIFYAQELAREKARFASELEDAEERARLAEERNQRAMSMAQQTKRGHVYVISNIGSFGEDVYKIGMTRRLEPNSTRCSDCGTSSPRAAFTASRSAVRSLTC